MTTMSKFAIIETGGKQYRIAQGDTLKIEKLDAEVGGTVIFDKVLLTAEGDKIEVGTPYVPGATVRATVLREARARKVIIFKYASKTRYRRKRGHRQHFTEVQIV